MWWGGWEAWLPFLPKYPNLNVNIMDMPVETLAGLVAGDDGALMIHSFLPKNEPLDRYRQGIMTYDEVMTLTFLFSDLRELGKKYPNKRFFVIDGSFAIEGIFGIWNKVFTAARYAMAKGFEPIFRITSSHVNIYSDAEGEDIWGKFFLQPSGISVEEVMQSQNVTFSPDMNILNIMRHIMDEESTGVKLSWKKGIFNERVESYIAEQREKFLPDAEHTLGVLIRGTDYTKTNLPGHARHADLEMMVEKIGEVEQERGEYRYIFLSTEDADIYDEMKRRFGERLLATDQERFSVKEGELLFDLHRKEKRDGFRLGVEYLATLRLLSECESLIASGNCGGTSEAIRENAGKYQYVHVFNLGINPQN